MAKHSLQGVRFIASAPEVKKLPLLKDSSGRLIPEVAVLGRSNVGKSSLLNMIFQTRGLVKTSATPGKTRLLNLFVWKDQLAFVDLPGYGYAAVSDAMKRDWVPMMKGYFKYREPLQLILYLFDIRRDPNEEDIQLMQWLQESKHSVVLVITKADKVSKGQIAKRCKEIGTAFNALEYPIVPCSVPNKLGKDLLLKILWNGIQS